MSPEIAMFPDATPCLRLTANGVIHGACTNMASLLSIAHGERMSIRWRAGGRAGGQAVEWADDIAC